MREVTLAVGILGGLALLSGLGRLPFENVLILGGWLVAGGLGVGLPAGLVYHVALRRELLRAGALPRGWVFRPTSFHDGLEGDGRRRVLPAFFVGAVACGAVFLGCALLFVAAMTELGVLPG
jgi:hypothetical protein